jgi:catechol 2,3-dioxygenase-like lactoylglutathione lyase family enzyme
MRRPWLLALTGISWCLAERPALPVELVGLDHYAVNVADLQRAADWYQRILGFNVLHKWQTTWMVGKDNIKVGLFLRPDAKPPSDPDKELLIQHVAFLLDGDKFDAALKELADKGVPVDGPEDTGIAYSAFLNDADGNLLEFTTYHPPPPPAPAPPPVAAPGARHSHTRWIRTRPAYTSERSRATIRGTGNLPIRTDSDAHELWRK